MTVADLVGHLSHFGEREEVMLEARFPDPDYEVCDWAFTYLEGPGGPALVTSVHGSSFAPLREWGTTIVNLGTIG